MKYVVVIEKGPTSYGAYVPDLPVCVAVGKRRDFAYFAFGKAGLLYVSEFMKPDTY